MRLLERYAIRYLVKLLRKRYLFDSEMIIRNDGLVYFRQDLTRGKEGLSFYSHGNYYGDVS